MRVTEEESTPGTSGAEGGGGEEGKRKTIEEDKIASAICMCTVAHPLLYEAKQYRRNFHVEEFAKISRNK